MIKEEEKIKSIGQRNEIDLSEKTEIREVLLQK